jgi:hypothetical protein
VIDALVPLHPRRRVQGSFRGSCQQSRYLEERPVINLSFLAQSAPSHSTKEGGGYVAMAATGGIAGGVLGWKLDGAPGLAFGAAAGTVMGVALANFIEAAAGRDVARMFANAKAQP